MVSFTTLYDEYIDRSKLSEQKNPFEYIVPPPPPPPPPQEGSEYLFQFKNYCSQYLLYQFCRDFLVGKYTTKEVNELNHNSNLEIFFGR